MRSSSAASAFSAPSTASPRLSALRTACLAAAMTATMTAAHPALAQGAAPSPAGRLEPADGAQGVQRLVQPRLRLASAAEAREVLRAGVELLGPLGLPVPGVLRVEGAAITFEPAMPLAGCTHYRLAPGGAGTAQPDAGFTTACSRWSEPVQIDDRRSSRRPDRGADAVQVAASAGGGAWAAWFQSDGRRSAIEASRLSPDTGSWQGPRRIDLRAAAGATLPALATLADGRVLAAWLQDLHGHAAVFARVLGDDARAPARRLDDPRLAASPTAVQLATDAAGNAVAVWQQPGARHTEAWAAHWSAAQGRWSGARRLDSAPAPDYAPVVAGAGDDLFVAAWERGAAGHERVAASRWTGHGWSAPRLLSAPGVRARRVGLALDARGELAAAWIQGDADARRVALRRLALPAWAGAPARLLGGAGLRGPAVSAALVLDPAGDAAVAWEQQSSPQGDYVIEATRWMHGAPAPQPGERLDPSGQRNAGNPVLVSDPAGNLVCAWYQDTTQGLQVFDARFDASSRRWQPAQLLSDPRDTVQASFPALAVDAAGSVTAVWQQYNGWRDIVMASRLP
ncbi:MAG: hypothetical protein KGR99_11540 [Betaproteobacteria bacterium]|nr:hypothetical protein [Betaproteobacteria bacterium]MBU6512926.1 hypothetical protein [Betaproteobacteria bacterium]